MSKKHKDDSCCCNMCCHPCCYYTCNPCSCCCPCYQNTQNMNNIWDNGILEAIIFWLIACGAGLLNTSSILIILLFLLYGWSNQGCSNGILGL